MTFDPIIRLNGSDLMRLSAFLANNEGLDADEIVADLQGFGIHRGGGGACPEFRLTVVSDVEAAREVATREEREALRYRANHATYSTTGDKTAAWLSVARPWAAEVLTRRVRSYAEAA